MNDEFETLPFAAGGVGSEMGDAAGFETTDEMADEMTDEWSAEGEADFEEAQEGERGRMGGMGGRMGGAGGGGRGMGRNMGRNVSRGDARPVYRAGDKPGRGPESRPSRPPGRPQPGPRPGRWPRGPYWGPFYGGWPGGVMSSEPMGYPLPLQDQPGPGGAPAPAFEPIDLPDDDGGEADGAEDELSWEIPPEFLATISGLTLPGKPTTYKLLGSLMKAPALFKRILPKEKTGGFYLIVFPAGRKFPGKYRAYSGETDNLYRRMQEHILELARLGFTAPRHKVYYATSTLDDKARRAVEYAIHDKMITDHFGVLTNPKREFEVSAWS